MFSQSKRNSEHEDLYVKLRLDKKKKKAGASEVVEE